MSGSDASPVTPDEQHEVTTPGSPDSDFNSTSTTPLEEPSTKRPTDIPGLRSISDPHAINPNSTAMGVLGMARKPPLAPSSSFLGAGAMENSAMAKARAFQQQRLQKAMSPISPMSPMNLPGMQGGPNGQPGPPLRMPDGLPGLHRPIPPHPKSEPSLGLSQRRAGKMGGMKLSEMGGGSPTAGGFRRNAPKLSDIQGPAPGGLAPPGSHGSKMDDFKKYIDTEKGWLTFDGAATITREGVNFSNGQTFSISLDEVEILDELGKGNYGTVYKARHARPKVPRFGHGLSGVKPPMQHAYSDSTITTQDSQEDGTTGVTMAMKEIRLELDDAKFTTILKELVILHECVSPYIIDFYGAFFQEGAVYICIEYMDGGSIDKLYTGGIPENVLRKITYSTVMGLKSLKDEHSIIHRDVKPTNILANTRGQIKICDFGVSGNLVASIARTNIGCQSYMAPERISGGGMAQSGASDGTYSVASDVWSLGLTIIECATGRYPYPPEVSSTIFSQLSAIVEGDPPGLPEEGYSDTAKDFVNSCLHKVPKQRPTYAMLLKHPWLKSLHQPQTITEEAEEGEEADRVAEAVGKIELNPTVGDPEVAAWVTSVLNGTGADAGRRSSKPALHAAPLDGVSPGA